MGFKISEVAEGSQILLKISEKGTERSIEMNASIKKILKDNISLISLDYDSDKVLNFTNVVVDVEYHQEMDLPIIWHNVKIISYQSEYILQTVADGTRFNRRECFRVGISVPAKIDIVGGGSNNAVIKDISLSGFAITDRKKELILNVGDRVTTTLADLGFVLGLAGQVVRIEEHEDMIIYGLEICNLCKDLPTYISAKQRNRAR